MKYYVTLGDRTMTVDVDGDDLRVDGKPVDARVERVTGTPEVQVVIDGNPSIIAVDAERTGSCRIIDQGVVWEIQVEDERTRHIRLLASPARASDANLALKAPMPGLVVQIMVGPGDVVVAGQALLALEAMKMENELKATAPCRVGEVLVKPGEAVEKGQVLVKLEAT